MCNKKESKAMNNECNTVYLSTQPPHHMNAPKASVL